jgi:hypothetical protein
MKAEVAADMQAIFHVPDHVMAEVFMTHWVCKYTQKGTRLAE